MSTETAADLEKAIRTTHRKLADRLTELVADITEAAADGEPDAEAVALFSWGRNDLLPHLKGDEAGFGVGAVTEAPATALALRAISGDNTLARSAIDDLDGADDAMEIVSLAAAVKTAFELHVEHVEQVLLPALGAADLAEAAALAPQIVGGERIAPKVVAPTSGTELPEVTPISGTEEVDVRPLAHQARHNVIFGKMQALTETGAIVVINDHDPKPLRYQTDALWPGVYEWTYLTEGPEEWRVRIAKA